MHTTFNYCLDEGILGVGWRVEKFQNTKDWDECYTVASNKYDNLNICKYIHDWISPNDLVWTRDPSGEYYLANVQSGWEYWISDDAKTLDIDIANIFRCEILPVDIDDVPGKIVACFRPSRAIQGISDEKAQEYSKYLWNKKKGESIYSVDKSKYQDIFMLLDDEETEDLVFLYLQSHGWYVIPNSRKADTMSYEYLCVNPVTSEIAGTQVKTGNTELITDDYVDAKMKVFLFQTNDLYHGGEYNHVEIIPRKTLLTFLENSLTWLPKSIRYKYDIVNAS